MSERIYDVIVIGGGPAGLAAASAAGDEGARQIVIFERGLGCTTSKTNCQGRSTQDALWSFWARRAWK